MKRMYSKLYEKSGSEIIRKLEKVGLNNDIPDCKALIDTVADAVGNFENNANELHIDNGLIDAIKADFLKV